MLNEKQVISAAEAAAILGVSRTALGNFDTEGVLGPVLRVGSSRIRLYNRLEVERFQREREARAAAGLAGNGRGARRMLGAVK